MATTAELFAAAVTQHQTGALAQARQLYLQVLQADPAHADAWCFLGAICQAHGQLAEAEAHFRRAVQLVPGYTSARNSLGVALAEQGKLDEAAVCFLQVIAHEPGDADAHNNLGQVRIRQGHADQAIACYLQALQLQPDHAGARTNLDLARPGPDAVLDAKQRGVAFAQQGRFEEAKICFQQALALSPEDADAHNNLSSALILQDRFDEALPHCQMALRLRPAFPQALNNLGNVRQNQGLLDEAVRYFEEALQLAPTYADAWYNLANTLKSQGKLSDAIEHYRQAIRLLPDHRDAHNNLGVLLHESGRPDEALPQLEEAVRLHPDNAEARWNRGLARLLTGDWPRGWVDYEWRWRQKGYPQRSFAEPLWDGADLSGKTILLFAEQGLGDMLQFVRYVPLVKDRGGQVIVECPSTLVPLWTSLAGVDQLIPREQLLPPFEVQAPLPSLPGILGTTVDNVPAAVPYLNADPCLVEKWRVQCRVGGVFGTHPGDLVGSEDSTHPTTHHPPHLVGIAWQGDPSYRHDCQRSIPLSQFAPLANVEGVQLISLQKGFGIEQLAANPFPVRDLGNQLDEKSGAFMDTAAIMKNLDLVISSDTAIAHLAGALGVPVWVALPFVPDWRWLLDREDSPWYPTMRLFRQISPGQWENVFQRMAQELETIVAKRQSTTHQRRERQ
ncbi:MAG TPA: tetratricopeptide repeat protein [Gemmataceae bacterium]|nr:tetratricopeptide repeat protein [Gemmataceae bacterium]